MSMRPLKRVSPTTRDRAITLRHNSTAPERVLWTLLSGRKLEGLKFRRQHPIEPYIVDFYCAEERLVVELDGKSHNEREEYDKQRSELLAALGLTVFRVTNDDVLTNLDGVAAGVLRIVQLGRLSRRESKP
ncbi:MAG TPA: endonuclease domain-containing protein [Lacipirellulaceae bacterium]|nr:endonuclease domain-containing protein [Lacipirellulaceae bacterium]